MNHRRIALFVFAFVFAFPQSGFSQMNSDRDIEADDNGRVIPGGRVAYEIFPGNDTRRRGALLDLMQAKASFSGRLEDGEKLRRSEFWLALGGELAGGKGEDEFNIRALDRVRLSGGEIPGPTRVDAEFDGVRSHLDLRIGGRFFDVLSIGSTFGLVLQKTEVNLRAPGLGFTQDETKAAFAIGNRIEIRPIPLLDLYGKLALMFGDFKSFDAEVGGRINVTENLGFYAGYRRWTFNDRKGASSLQFQLNGPTFGASLQF